MEEFEEYTIPKVKQIALNRLFVVQEEKPKEEEYEYEHYINLTSKLIKRPYLVTHKLVGKWPLEKIIRHYDLATKHNGKIPSEVYWWWKRKNEM